MSTTMEEEKKLEKRTDLALEVRESFPQDEEEVEGVCLFEGEYAEGMIGVTTVEIRNEHGAQSMGKPQGTYITLEFKEGSETASVELQDEMVQILSDTLLEMAERLLQKQDRHCYFVTGLGNRFATPDSLGPYVVEHINVNRHLQEEDEREENLICAVVPGVMAQTGLETGEILGGIIERSKPDLLIVVDALATRSIHRLCRTIQITDTGILPGAGVGNHRFPINQETMGIPVIAIGVPTVVEANTIVLETMEEVLQKEQFNEQEISTFLDGISRQVINNLFVTPKDIEAQISQIGEIIAKGINCFQMKS